MKNKQKAIFEILLACICTVMMVKSRAQNQELLARADSLFQEKHYTQSLEVYDQLFQQHYYSDAMLLRMAFIKEGLGKLGESLYFLNLYFASTGDERALEKMQQVAARNNLTGYDHSELRLIQSTLHRHEAEINISLAAIILLLFVTMIFSRRRSEKKPFATGFAMLFVCGLLFTCLNFANSSVQGIVDEAPVYLMSGPSSGASVVAIIGEGTKFTILDKTDVWVRVQWRGESAFVKESQLLRVEI